MYPPKLTCFPFPLYKRHFGLIVHSSNQQCSSSRETHLDPRIVENEEAPQHSWYIFIRWFRICPSFFVYDMLRGWHKRLWCFEYLSNNFDFFGDLRMNCREITDMRHLDQKSRLSLIVIQISSKNPLEFCKITQNVNYVEPLGTYCATAPRCAVLRSIFASHVFRNGQT